MLRLRRLGLALGLVGAILLSACGPNALPRQEAPPAEAAPIVTGAGLEAPAAQIGGLAQLEGRLLIVQQGDLFLWEKGRQQKLGEGYTWRQPSWSPDGSKFAYVFRGPSFSDIFVTDVGGSAQTRLTRSQSTFLEDNSWNFRPTWSPDGKQIAFVSDTAGSANPTLWLMNADGTGRRQLTTTSFFQEAVDGLSWSPDGQKLAMSVFQGGASAQIAVAPMTGAARQPWTIITNYAAGAMDPAWSPDGQHIAYAAREGRAVDIYVANADGSSPQKVTSTGTARSPEWSPNGRNLAYLSSQSGSFEVWAVDVQAAATLEFKNPRQVTIGLGLDAPSGISWAN